MTAIGLFITRQAAHLVADASFYDAESRLIDVRDKISVSTYLNVAIACSGCCDINRIAPRLADLHSQRAVLAMLPQLVAALRAENVALDPSATVSPELMLYVALWCPERCEAQGWVISTDRSYLGDRYAPETLVAVDAISSPPVEASIFTNLTPRRGAQAVLKAQRPYRWNEGDDHLHVGGYGQMVSVSGIGITRERVIEWPDCLGERIRPD